MHVDVVRSGLVEARHETVAAAVDSDGRVIATMGDDLERTFFLRSALKPFQALASQRAGAGLSGESLAVACASHGGAPVHAAYVHQMLDEVGLEPSALRCPPDRPSARGADRIAAAMGDRGRRRIHHNCSGKHAGMLRACVASDWSLDYLPESHPLQQSVIDIAADVTRETVTPLGIDGCGVPTVRSTIIGLARAFSRLATDPDYSEIRTVMSRFPALTSNGERGDEDIARWIPAAVKGGAQGCLGVAWYGGVGIAAKAWTGSDVAVTAAVGAMADHLGLVSDHQRAMLAFRTAPAVLGGGVPVGTVLVEPA